MTYKVAALYRFVAMTDLPVHQQALNDIGAQFDLCGTLLIAHEGINGTIASSNGGVDAVLDYLETHFEVSKGEVKFSDSSRRPFLRLKVRIKPEIVTLRQPQADPTKQVGTYVDPQNWNELIADPDVLLIDTRNDYETKIGIFDGAIDPKIKIFTEFVDYVRKNLDPAKHKKVAMFCTGGIRCEKASSFMLSEGFETVYHLKGGILKYLEDVPVEQSKWNGECFVFDRRVGVGHGLEEGTAKLCHGCRETLMSNDLMSEQYEFGVSCPHCFDSLSGDEISARRMRHEQMMKRKSSLSS
ncbi:MAG: rhodanese-related sulfurtransferase [Alphaproteobacteria bacterium]|nr:rhodanese-related sulfurtransferase [Alphaproteobacteria bacterium]MCB1550841.1 rhodanese-related sulfurtransferase [Alphaproteobacteria bacterium]MCB9984254.1 rhodanese-related sulfurtransferase [Micavibrio sp.]HPQ50930.1 rhodanese-related sulfurtransferase [Alphaproteobacteria bacterium]HRK97098.1 rhodanese-related sulfurtransferase [Alphaproteobacteria bacterium]